MAKKLKDLPHVIKIFHKYLDDREKNDLSTILDKNEEYRNVKSIHDGLKNIQSWIDNPAVETGSIAVDLNEFIKITKADLKGFSDREEFKKEKKNIQDYTTNKKEIIESLLEEDVEEITGANGTYYNEKINIINLPNVTIGRFNPVDIVIDPVKNINSYGSAEERNSIYLGNNILPIIETSANYGKEYLYFMCAGDFLFKKHVWNEECPNFLHKKFSAKATVKKLVERALKNKKVTGSKPEWVCNMELMS